MEFTIPCGCMVGNVGEGQANQSVIGIPTAAIRFIIIIDGIDSFRRIEKAQQTKAFQWTASSGIFQFQIVGAATALCVGGKLVENNCQN